MSHAMKWGTIFGLPINEYVIHHVIKGGDLAFLLAFMPKYYCLHFFYHCISHIIHKMKSGPIRVSCSKHVIDR